MKAKIIAIATIAILFLSIYVFLSVDYKEVQQESILTIIAYFVGMFVCLPAMILTPLFPDSFTVFASNIAVGAVGGIISLLITYLIYRFARKHSDSETGFRT